MTRLSLQVQDGDESALTALQESEQSFVRTLSALQNGGRAPYLADRVVHLPATQDAQILSALRDVSSSWEQYQSILDATSVSPELQADLAAQSDDLVQKADRVVRLYEVASTAKVNRLRAIQVTFLACALALLAVGAWITRRSLLKPLQALELAAKRLGVNKLETPVQVEGPEEMRTLSQPFEIQFGRY